jgi:hypothetical protein
MITAYLVGDQKLIAKLSAMPEGIRQGVARAITRLSLEGTCVSQRKVSGEVLNVRTGALLSGTKVSRCRSGCLTRSRRWRLARSLGTSGSAQRWRSRGSGRRRIRQAVGGAIHDASVHRIIWPEVGAIKQTTQKSHSIFGKALLCNVCQWHVKISVRLMRGNLAVAN